MSRIVVSQFVSADGVIEDPVGMETTAVLSGDRGRAVGMRLTGCRAVGEGVAILVYQPARA
jgi:hypothetical protein